MGGKYACQRVVLVSSGMNLQNGSFLRSVVSVKPIDNMNIGMLLKTFQTCLIFLVKDDKRSPILLLDLTDRIDLEVL